MEGHPRLWTPGLCPLGAEMDTSRQALASVARAHGVNANQVFYWCKLYGAGRLGNNAGAIKLLPVTVEASLSAPSAISGDREAFCC